LPVALAVAAAAVCFAASARLRPIVLAAGPAAMALAIPAGLHLAWWSAPILDLAVVAATLVLIARDVRPTGAFVARLVVVVVLGVHAISVGFGRPGVAAGALAAVALMGFGLARGAAEAREARPETASGETSGAQPQKTSGKTSGKRRGLAIGGVLTGVVAMPLTAWTAADALGSSANGQRVAVTVVFGAILVAAAGFAVRRGDPVDRGLAFAVALVAGWGVALLRPTGAAIEAYVIPVSLMALTVSLIARRDQPPSWLVFGPALGVGLLPSLVSVLAGEGQHLRRLLLGLAALAILLAGSRARLSAPVVAGGGVLAVLALHEVGLVWDLIPRWIPLAAGGLLLVLIAATLESRRRDLARFRHALGRMS
jgi:hypothetical protein